MKMSEILFETTKKQLTTQQLNSISKDPIAAYEYAKDVIKGRFPEAEYIIAQDGLVAFLYAKDVIKGRFPEAERRILRSAYNISYLEYILSITNMSDKQKNELMKEIGRYIIADQSWYNAAVKYLFNDNNILLKRWIQYGEDVREEME